MQSMNECDLKAREYYHFRALKYAICDGSNAAHIQECFQSLKDYRAHIAHAKSMELRKLFESLPPEVKRQRYFISIGIRTKHAEHLSIAFSTSAFGDENAYVSLEHFHSQIRIDSPFSDKVHFANIEPFEYGSIKSYYNHNNKSIPDTLLPFVLPAFIPLMEVVCFPDEYSITKMCRSFKASKFCTRAQAINGYELIFYDNLNQCSDQWIESTITHHVRFLHMSFFMNELNSVAMRRIITNCVHIARPRFIRILIRLIPEQNTPLSINIIPLLHVLKRIITDWVCDVEFLLEACYDLDSIWLASLINLNPLYPFRLALLKYKPTGDGNRLHGYKNDTSQLVIAKLGNDYLKREIKLHSLRLHYASKFFTFGQLPYNGPMETTAQCFSACAYYNRHFPEMSAYLGGEFPQRPISLQS